MVPSPAQQQSPPAVVGQGNYVVRQGDCMNSIAFRHGFFWSTLWNLGENAQLKSARKSPNILLPGDRVTVPDIRKKEESGATEQRHRFRRKGVPAKLKVAFSTCGKPRAGEPYVLNIDGKITQGELDSDGVLQTVLPPDARKAVVHVGEERERFDIKLGGIDPIDTVIGVQQRLGNLGLLDAAPSGTLDDPTREALRRFQEANDLEPTGDLNDETRSKIQEVHRS